MTEVRTQTELERVLEYGRERNWGPRVIKIDDEYRSEERFLKFDGPFKQTPWVFLIRSKAKRTVVPEDIDERGNQVKARFDVIAEYIGNPMLFAPEEKEEDSLWKELTGGTGIGERIFTIAITGVVILALAALAIGIFVAILTVVLGIAFAAAMAVGVAALIVYDPSLVLVIRSSVTDVGSDEEVFAFVEVGRWTDE